MANTSSRTLRLLSLLQAHRFWSGTELADLGVSVRTLRRDVDRLRELGYPVQANRGVDGGYRLAAGAALPPLVLDDEAVALVVGLQAAAHSAVAGTAESSVRARTKVAQVMPTAAAGTSSPPTWLGMTGAASGWTGSSAPTAPAIGSPRDVCRPRTPRPSCAPGSTTFPRPPPSRCSSRLRLWPFAIVSAGGSRLRTSTASVAGCE